MEERVRFVLQAAREELGFAELCRQFGISRKTGYKWWRRYQMGGLAGMQESSRRPRGSPTRLPPAVVTLILRERSRHGSWGPKKLREVLATKHGITPVPAASTIGKVLQRHGLTRKWRRRRPVSPPDRTTRTVGTRPNEVWAADFKGWFKTGDGQRCDPLTISDLASRYVLACRIVTPPTIAGVLPVFRQVFRRFGLPEALRVDNGAPFGSRGACGLSRLSAGWVALGIRVEFIDPGHPEQNGGHERMHRTLKAETTRPPAATPRAQQRRFDRWRHEFNHERPHEALGQQRPAQHYGRSGRRYTDTPAPPGYPPHYHVRRVRHAGVIQWRHRLRYLGEALHGLLVGLVEVGEAEYDVYLGPLRLGRLTGDNVGLVPVAPPVPPGRRTRRATPLGALLEAATSALRAEV
jgi:transposase InsO family protein